MADGGHGPETSKGVISRTILLDGESLVHGNELLEEIGVTGNEAHDRTGYTLGAVRNVLDRVEPPTQHPGLSAWEVFVGYLVLDTLVGNVDRHQDGNVNPDWPHPAHLIWPHLSGGVGGWRGAGMTRCRSR